MTLELVPTLLLATEKERQAMEVFDHSLHWKELDSYLNLEGLLAEATEIPTPSRMLLEKFFARQYGRICGIKKILKHLIKNYKDIFYN